MKILYTAAGTPIPGTHGGSVHALELCRGLARRGNEVHLAALPGSSGAPMIDGVHLHPLQRRLSGRFFEWTAAASIGALIDTLSPDVVVERFYTFGGAGVSAAHKRGVPAVLEINSPARDYPGSTRDALDKLTLVRPIDRRRRRMLDRCAALYATSLHLVPPDQRPRTTVIVNGVDTDRFQPGEPAADDGPLRFVYVSSFRAWHGAEDLVAAVGRSIENGASVHLTCIGEGPRWQRARDVAAASGANEHIDFRGRIPHDEVPAALAAADVGVAPFAPDQFRALELGWFWSPIKIFEYLAAGLPVVTADIPELRELLPEEVGSFYPPGDVAGLADVLADLAANRAAVRRRGVAARSLAVENYTWDHQAEAVEQVLRAAAV